MATGVTEAPMLATGAKREDRKGRTDDPPELVP